MLKIEKSKILFFPYIESKRYRNLTKIKGGIFRRMNEYVEIADNVTFGDFFKFLIKEKNLINLIFAASMYGVSFDLLINDFKRKFELKDDEIQYLEICWYVDYDNDELVIDPHFHGISKKEENNFNEMPIGLDFVSIYKLKNYPLKLNEVLEIIDNSTWPDESRTILKSTKQYTLYDIIHSVLYELTWYGTPAMRDKEKKTILDVVRKMEIVDDIFKT
jgi:hypothetical protein